MSLLLDALKKAAQEKLEKQHQSGELKSESLSLEENNISSSERKEEPVQASPASEFPLGLSGDRRTAEAVDDDALELMPLDDDELRIDTDAFSENFNSDYEYSRSEVLASELRAFNSDTDLQSEIIGRDNSPDAPVWSMESPQDLSPGSPRQAAQVFSSKTPDRGGRLRLLLSMSAVSLAILLAAGLFAYNYLFKADGNFPVVESGSLQEPLPAETPSPADAEVDPTLLIEQEDYDSLLTDDLNASERQGEDSMPEDARSQEDQSLMAETGINAVKPRETTPPRKAASFGEAQLNISRTKGKEPLQDILTRGYTAYNKGEFENAEIAYRQALTRAPDSRDAMLGMAAVRYIQGDTPTAVSYYRELLQRDPKDELAFAALAGIEEDAAGPILPQTDLSDESRIKLLLAEKPDSGYLHFALGNVYADGRRWAEAQRAYFDAYRLESGNPDYAFNLAVSLDHLGKKREAARYYRQSLTLARERKPNFDTQLAVSRLDSLQEF